MTKTSAIKTGHRRLLKPAVVHHARTSHSRFFQIRAAVAVAFGIVAPIATAAFASAAGAQSTDTVSTSTLPPLPTSTTSIPVATSTLPPLPTTTTWGSSPSSSTTSTTWISNPSSTTTSLGANGGVTSTTNGVTTSTLFPGDTPISIPVGGQPLNPNAPVDCGIEVEQSACATTTTTTTQPATTTTTQPATTTTTTAPAVVTATTIPPAQPAKPTPVTTGPVTKGLAFTGFNWVPWVVAGVSSIAAGMGLLKLSNRRKAKLIDARRDAIAGPPPQKNTGSKKFSFKFGKEIADARTDVKAQAAYSRSLLATAGVKLRSLSLKFPGVEKRASVNARAEAILGSVADVNAANTPSPEILSDARARRALISDAAFLGDTTSDVNTNIPVSILAGDALNSQFALAG